MEITSAPRSRRVPATVLSLLLSLTVTGTAVAVTGSPALALPPAPSAFAVLAGGPSIALLWRPQPAPAERPVRYQIKRNNVEIATVTDPGLPVRSPSGTVADVVRYVDRFTDITPLPAGQTFTYQIVPLNSANQPGTATATKSAVLPAQNSNTTTPKPVVTVDTSGLTSTQAATVNGFVPLIEDWYPKLSDALNAAPFPASPTVNLVVAHTGGGGAEASGTTVTIDPDYLDNPAYRPEFNGTVLHEATHLIQAGYQCPECMWVAEGVAVYATHSLYQDFDPIAPQRWHHYLHKYSEAERLLRYVTTTYHKPDLLRDLNLAARTTTSITAFFEDQTGLTTNALWNAMQLSIYPGFRATTVRRYQLAGGSGCVETPFYDNTVPPRVNACWVTEAQEIIRWPAASGSGLLELYGRCLDTENGSVAAGTRIVLADCAYDAPPARQRWVLRANGTLLNVGASLCARTWNGTTAVDQELKLATCTADASRTFTLAAATQ
ncbi:basic secretory protein-like protein [Jidongwangia harbinensis]|uniref:basic secretory protein-like protein n=1 Tax=Jidongwangia harbinensis TaxID=2878561 RepID=UPI001CDA19CF|nr:basic secretory protein-like protein [Jidongwangia harbinensis]MCA2214110.1 hypothetical protein [Jidongwangia harbinensis]